jgi:ferric-dicitrate binding protein FerR (iron transport regulator)
LILTKFAPQRTVSMVEDTATDGDAVNQEQEDELLMHVAAGTDPFTALAALPREDESQDEPRSPTPERSVGGLLWAVLVFLAVVAAWWAMQ